MARNFGTIILSFGRGYVDCTVAAIRSLAANAPRTPVMVITNRRADKKSGLCRRHSVRVKYMPKGDAEVRAIKTQLYRYSPWPYTLLLDADCWVNKELSSQFRMLNMTPIALTHAFHHPSIGTAAHIGSRDRSYTVRALGRLRFMPQYASGMIFFRRDDEGVRRLFDAWHEEWKVFRGKDQGALMRAVVRSQVFPLVLARRHWLTSKEGDGFVSHSFGKRLPSMPRKGHRSPRKYASIP